VSQLGIEIPIHGDGSLSNLHFVPNCMAFKQDGGSMEDPHNNKLFQCLFRGGGY
jgi:hypothetical protein